MDNAEMERQLQRLSPDLRELVTKVRAGELPPSVITDLVAELEDLGRSDPSLSAALDRLYEQERSRPGLTHGGRSGAAPEEANGTPA